MGVHRAIVPHGTMQHPVLLGHDSWMRFEQRTYTTLPRLPSRPLFGELSLATPYKDGLSTFVRDNRPSQDIIHLEFAGVHAVSLSATPSLVPVNLVRSSGLPAPTGHYLVDMLPRDGLSCETEIFVANGYQNIPLSGFTDLELGDLLGTSSSPLTQIPVSALQVLPTTSPPASAATDVHALLDNITVHDDSTPPADPPKTPCDKLLQRLTVGQRTSFLRVWDQLPQHFRDVSFDLRGSGWSPSVIKWEKFFASSPTFSPRPKPTSARAPLFRSRFPSPRIAPPYIPALNASTLSSPKRPTLCSTNIWLPV